MTRRLFTLFLGPSATTTSVVQLGLLQLGLLQLGLLPVTPEEGVSAAVVSIHYSAHARGHTVSTSLVHSSVCCEGGQFEGVHKAYWDLFSVWVHSVSNNLIT